jgi:hypothetical protein
MRDLVRHILPHPRAVAWAIKAASYLRDKQNTNTQVSRNIGGPVFQLHWVSTHPSLADVEKTMKQVEADQGYRRS